MRASLGRSASNRRATVSGLSGALASENRPLGSSNLVRRPARLSGLRAESPRRVQSPSVGSRQRPGERRPRVAPRKSRAGCVIAYGIRHRTNRAGTRLSARTQKRHRRASAPTSPRRLRSRISSPVGAAGVASAATMHRIFGPQWLRTVNQCRRRTDKGLFSTRCESRGARGSGHEPPLSATVVKGVALNESSQRPPEVENLLPGGVARSRIANNRWCACRGCREDTQSSVYRSAHN